MESVLLSSFLNFINLNPESLWVMLGTGILLVLSFFVLFTALLIRLTYNTMKLLRITSLSKSDRDLQIGIRKSQFTSDVLRSIKHDNFAQRVTLIQLHNGVHSVNGIDMYRFSFSDQEHTSAEPTATWTESGKPLSFLVDVISKFKNHKDKYASYPEIHTMTEDQHDLRTMRRLYFDKFSTKSVYFFPVYDVSGLLFAIGMVEYTTQAYDMEPDRLYSIASEFTKLGGLLSGKAAERRNKWTRWLKSAADREAQ